MTDTVAMTIPVARLNHAVLFVRDADGVGRVLRTRLRVRGRRPTSSAARPSSCAPPAATTTTTSACSRSVPRRPAPPRGSVGLYHLAWEVPTIEDLADAGRILSEAGALGGASDHGVSKSLYGADPDGNEFEIMWRVPREAWGDYEEHGAIMPLDIDAEVAKWGRDRPV